MNSFCHFGGHDTKTSRKAKYTQSNSGLEFKQFLEDASDNTVSVWLVCQDCIRKFNLNVMQDPTMNVLLAWAYEYGSNIDDLPVSLKEKPLRIALFIQYIDELLSYIRRTKFGDKFPVYLSDLNGET